MAIFRDRPYLGSNFLVEFSGSRHAQAQVIGFCEVIFPDFLAKRPRRSSATAGQLAAGTNLILRRGVQGSLDLYAWFDAARRPLVRGKRHPRRDLRVTLLGDDHAERILAWRFTDVRPVRLAYSPLNALAGEVLIETLELEFGRFEME